MTYGQYRGQLLGAFASTAAVAAPALAQTAAPTPTFTKDVAPIFQAKCESCHRPDSIAPMSLVSYEQSRPWARSIRDRVQTRQMPPWHLDKSLGIQHFENDRSLSDAEIDTIVKWVAAGAPKGDMKDMPKPVELAERRRAELREPYGKPDPVPPRRPTPRRATRWTRVDKPVQATGLTEDALVRAIEMRPGAVKAATSPPRCWPACSRTTATTARRLPPAATNPAPACSWSGRSASRARSCARTRAS